jgi:glutathione synthase/RimK-type ligase-like ATP-grasp enzyme
MKLAIQPREGSYSTRWIEYCEEKGIDYKLVNCYGNDIIEQMADCDALLWHFYHENARDIQVAKQVLFALEGAGKSVFPDFPTSWHFDDKVGQKYLLESVGAPLVPSYAFYTRKDAVAWANATTFPKVFKLRGGASSDNVKLVKTRKRAIRLIKKAFGRGFRLYNPWVSLRDRWRLYRLGLTDLRDVVKGVIRFVVPTYYSRIAGRAKGYAFFQDFIPDNDTDVRVLYGYGRCLAFRRVVRPGDFRASGSRVFDYDQSHVPAKAMQIVFEVADKLKIQSAAFDFVMKGEEPLIVELSYASGTSPEQNDHGYYDKDLKHYQEAFNPYDWVIEGVIKHVEAKNRE